MLISLSIRPFSFTRFPFKLNALLCSRQTRTKEDQPLAQLLKEFNNTRISTAVTTMRSTANAIVSTTNMYECLTLSNYYIFYTVTSGIVLLVSL